MTPRTCRHVNRKPAAEGRMLCLDCGVTFIPRGAPAYHGSYRGYSRHLKVKSGEWCWPPCESCSVAATKWRREYTLRPSARKARMLRGRARMAALARMRKEYPAAYLVAYREELARQRMPAGMRPASSLPQWEGILGALVQAATGHSIQIAESRIRTREASRDEITVMLQVRKLRVLLAGEGRG